MEKDYKERKKHSIRWHIFWTSGIFIVLVGLLIMASSGKGNSLLIFSSPMVSQFVVAVVLIIAILWLLISDGYLYWMYMNDTTSLIDGFGIDKHVGILRNFGYGLTVVSFLWGILSAYMSLFHFTKREDFFVAMILLILGIAFIVIDYLSLRITESDNALKNDSDKLFASYTQIAQSELNNHYYQTFKSFCRYEPNIIGVQAYDYSLSTGRDLKI